MTDHKTGTREEWLTARAELLERETELTRLSDELGRQRRELPWVPVGKEYTFQTADGPNTLAELFDDRSQLVIYYFMFGPGYTALSYQLVDRRQPQRPGPAPGGPPTAPSTSPSRPASSSCRRIGPRRSPSTSRSRTSAGNRGTTAGEWPPSTSSTST